MFLFNQFLEKLNPSDDNVRYCCGVRPPFTMTSLLTNIDTAVRSVSKRLNVSDVYIKPY